MTNNDFLRRLRYALNLKDNVTVQIFKKGGLTVTKEDVVNYLKKDIEVNYPSQYISDLPIDYKEYEMIFVFYFIILIELLTILK